MRWAAALAGTACLFVMATVVAFAGAEEEPQQVDAAAIGIHAVVLDAYLRADQASAATPCHVRWQILAGVGKVESHNAEGRTIEPSGLVGPAIVNRSSGALGPLQFLPSTWAGAGRDGSGDGVANPHNIYDAAMATASYLCQRAPGNYDADRGALATALMRYHGDDPGRGMSPYATEVLGWIDTYDQYAAGAGPAGAVLIGQGPAGPVRLATVGGITVAAHVAPYLQALLEAARGEGIALAGGGFRSHADQIRLRRANGCPDVYTARPSSCRVPTAIPGNSMHERGEAVDFTYGGGTIKDRSSPAFRWLAANAAGFGFYNLASEPWHWSLNGR